MKKVLWIGDGVAPTGFSTVNHNIIKHLPKDKYEVHHMAINYFGDPHGYDHLVYPASTPFLLSQGDHLGFGRLPEFLHKDIDIIFILNDVWVIHMYLKEIKRIWFEANKALPKIVVYYPVDGGGYTPDWFEHFDIVSKAVVYTEFGKKVTHEVAPDLELEIIPHGSANKDFLFKMEGTTAEIKKKKFPDNESLWEDSFIVLNANRNQPRKRIDIAFRAFALFAKDKPPGVMYYHHAGIRDAGWHFIDLVKRTQIELGYNLEKRIILSNAKVLEQRVPMESLNLIYNATDVGINAALGEGWGLVQTEHASIGKPQIVGDHTACRELFHDVGLLTPVVNVVRDAQHTTQRYFISAEMMANNLQKLYENKELYGELSRKSYEKFNRPEYSWEVIVQTWVDLFESL